MKGILAFKALFRLKIQDYRKGGLEKVHLFLQVLYSWLLLVLSFEWIGKFKHFV